MTVNVETTDLSLSGNPNGRRALLSCGTAHAVHDGYIDGIPMFLPIWSVAFGLSLTEAGLLTTVAVALMGALQIPSSLLAERFGERIVLAVGTLLAAFSFAIAAQADGLTGLLLAMAVLGAGAAVQHPLASSLVSGQYESTARRAAIGLYNFTGDVGKVALPAFGALLLMFLDWQQTALGFAAVGILVTPVIFVALGRIRSPQPTRVQAEIAPASGGWGIVDINGYRLLSAIYIIDTMIRIAFIALLPFVMVSKGIAMEETGFFLGLLFAGGAAGKFLCGFLSTRLGVLTTVLITEVATAIGIIAVALSPMEAGYVLYPLVGIALNGTSSALYGTVADFVSEERRARAFGLFYTLGVGFGATAPIVAGFIGDQTGVSVAIMVIGSLALVTLPLAVALVPALRRAGIKR